MASFSPEQAMPLQPGQSGRGLREPDRQGRATNHPLVIPSQEQLQEKFTFSADQEVLDMKMDDKSGKLVLRTYSKDHWFDISTWNCQYPLCISTMNKKKKEWEGRDYYKKYGRNKGYRFGFFRVAQEYTHNVNAIGGEFKQLCLDTKRDIYVATLHYKILFIDKSGKQTAKMRSDPKGPFPFQDLQGVAHSQKKDLYAVTDLIQHCVMIIDAENHTVESRLGGAPHFNLPYYVMFLTFDNKEALAVSDTGHHCVKVINLAGDLLKVYGESGPGDGQFQIPLGICQGPGGRILVADYDNNRVVCCWTRNGEDYWQVILTGESLAENHSPRFVTMGSNQDVLFVCTLTPQLLHSTSSQHKIYKFTGLSRVLGIQD